MGEKTIKKVLQDFGLTEKEAEIYVFLAKRGALKGGEIARRNKTNKAEVYRILKSLQTKGVIEATLESPTRFVAVKLETVIDLNIRVKLEEAASIENAKKDLLGYWKSINKTELDPQIEKFLVIEGNKKIYPKIAQMINETKSQLSTISSVAGLVQADLLGLFDAAFNHPLKSKLQFRFLTELSKQNVDAIKTILKGRPSGSFRFKGRNPDLGLRLFPRMVIRDDEEIMFYITPKADKPATEIGDACFWTNCKSLVHAFGGVFDELWRNAIDIQKRLADIENGTVTSEPYLV